MNKTFAAVLLVAFASSQAFGAPNDVIIQSRLDAKSTSWLIDKTRLVLGNVNIKDGLTATVPVPDDSLIPLSDLIGTPEFRRLAELSKEVFQIDFKNASLRIRIPRIYYHVAELHAQPTSLSVQDPSLLLETNASIRGFDINLLDGLQIDLMLLNPRSKKMESYLTGGLKPVAVSIPFSLPAAEFSLGLEATRNHGFDFKLKNYNLDKLPAYVKNHMSELEIKMDATGGAMTANDISVNPVIVKLSDLRRSIQFDDFRPLVQKKLSTILGKVLVAVGKSLKNTIGPNILTQVFSHHTRSDLALTGVNIYSNFTAQQLPKGKGFSSINWSFNIIRFDENDKPLPKVPVQLKGYQISGFITEGDDVGISGNWSPPQTLQIKKLFNYSTNSIVQVNTINEGFGKVFLTFFVIVFVVILTFFVYAILKNTNIIK